MKRVFLLEDDPTRVRLIREALIGKDVELTHAWDADKGLELFAGPYDLILLDHDLGGKQFVDSSLDNTGAGFVRRLPEGSITNFTQVVVHSYNGVGAKVIMLTLLERFGIDAPWAPFGPTLLNYLRSL